jgi:hypothetical protein
MPNASYTKNTPAQGWRKLLRQVSYRQETYRAVNFYTPSLRRGQVKSLK